MFAGYIAGFKVFSRTAYQKDVQKTSRRYLWEISISSEYLLNICNMPAMWVLNDIAVIYLYDILQIYIYITSNISTLSQKRTLVYFTNILEISRLTLNILMIFWFPDRIFYWYHIESLLLCGYWVKEKVRGVSSSKFKHIFLIF